MQRKFKFIQENTTMTSMFTDSEDSTKEQMKLTEKLTASDVEQKTFFQEDINVASPPALQEDNNKITQTTICCLHM